MPLLGSRGAASTTGFGALAANLGYFLRNSLRFRASNSAFLSRTPASTTNQRTFTWSGWVKRGTLGGSNAQYMFSARSANNDSGWFSFYFNVTDTLGVGGWTVDYRSTTQLFRDPSAWYHLVLAVDTTQSTASNRIKVYVNGSEITAFSTTNNPTQNFDYPVNSSAAAHSHGSVVGYSPTYNFDGYMAEVNFVDGQQLTPSSFGKTDAATNQWVPKKFGGAYGTNGFYLKFDDSSAVGKDSSGNGNNWSTSGHSVTPGTTYDLMTDVPTLTNATTANYATLNPLSTVGGTFSNGNLQFNGGGAWLSTNGTLAFPTSGQWYFEATLLNAPISPRDFNTSYNWIGVGLATNFSSTSAPSNTNVNGFLWGDNGFINNFTSSPVDSTVGLSSGDVIRIGVDTTNNTYTLYKNAGLVASSTFNVTAGTQLVPYHFSYSSAYGAMAVNFGQRPFAYPTTSGAFSGYKALNTYNLP
jgi:hypothetical protein